MRRMYSDMLSLQWKHHLQITKTLLQVRPINLPDAHNGSQTQLLVLVKFKSLPAAVFSELIKASTSNSPHEMAQIFQMEVQEQKLPCSSPHAPRQRWQTGSSGGGGRKYLTQPHCQKLLLLATWETPRCSPTHWHQHTHSHARRNHGN